MTKSIEDFKEKWEEYPEVVDKIINIINEKDMEKLRQFFREENQYCFENCDEQWIDDYWFDLNWLEEDAVNILKNIDK